MTQQTTQDVNDVLHLQTEHLQAEIAVDAGANLYRLYHRASGLEVLRSPRNMAELRRQPERYGIPVLFPPNRIADGRFTFEGREYVLPCNDQDRGNHIHGVMLDKAWQIIEQGDDHVRMVRELSAADGYGHDCTLELCYRLDGLALEQEMRVTNHSEMNMPVGLGYHTAFTMLPDSQVHATHTGQYWEIISPRALPTGRLLAWDEAAQPPFTDEQNISWHCPIGAGQHQGKPFTGAIITHPGLGVDVVYEVDPVFKHWYFWNELGGKGFFCIEPLSWMANALNMDMPAEVTGVKSLSPQATWCARTRINLVPHAS